jgi:hypothetical protein
MVHLQCTTKRAGQSAGGRDGHVVEGRGVRLEAVLRDPVVLRTSEWTPKVIGEDSAGRKTRRIGPSIRSMRTCET